MNPWLVFILAVILIHYLVDTLIGLVNLRALKPELPLEFADTFDRDEYARSQRYTRATTRFGLVTATTTTLVTVLFLLGGGFNQVDLLVRGLGLGPIPTGILFAGSLLLLAGLLNLPFSIYATFRIEAQFGFNRTTAAVFVADICKTVGLAALLGTPVLAAILWFFEQAGPYAWLYCWIGVIAVSFVLQFLAPVLIMPLFNRFTPLGDGPLKDRILAYAQAQDFAIGGIYTMDGSKRSTKLNAFFTGFGAFRKIVFFDTLLDKINTDEIVAVLAHEMGHFKKHHIWKMMAATILQTGLMFFLLSLFIENPGLFAAFGMEHRSIYASLIFFAFIFAPLNTLLSVVFFHFSRVYEFEADRYAAETTGTPEPLINALKKLSLANLANLTPHPAKVVYHYSHPPVLARIRALRTMTGA